MSNWKQKNLRARYFGLTNKRAKEHDDVPRIAVRRAPACGLHDWRISLVGCETASGMFYQFAIRSLCLVTKGKKGWQAENVRALKIGLASK